MMPGGELRAHRRDAVLQPAERPADRGREALVDVAGHLAELDHDALHRAERGGHVIGRLHGEVIAQLLPVLARGDEQARRAAGVAQAAADGELGGGQAALEPQPADPAADERHVRPPSPRCPPTARCPRSASAGADRSAAHARDCGAHPQDDALPGLQHSGLAEEDRVQHAERLPDLLAADGGQLRRGVPVHLARPVRQRDQRRLPDVLPDLRDLLVEAGRVEQVGHRLPGGAEHSSCGRTDARYLSSAAALSGTSSAGTPTSSAATTISST